MPAAVETMFSGNRQIPWHGLGEIVEGVLTAEEALQKSGLDWTVSKRPLFTTRANGTMIQVDDRVGIVRDTDDRTLGLVSKMYTPLQNQDAFSMFDELTDTGEAKYETAGSLRGGKVVWMTAKIPQTILVGGEDAVDLYLLLANSHDGSKAITAAVTPVRVVCMNTLNLSMTQAKSKWSIRHVKSAPERVNEARQTLGLTMKYAAEFETTANQLLDTNIELAAFEALAKDLAPKSEDIQRKLVEVYEKSPTVTRGTAWGAINAVGEYVQYGRNQRDGLAALDADWNGVNVRMRDRAAKLLLRRNK